MVDKYCDRFDVMYDEETGDYLETRCKDPRCVYCKERPNRLRSACQDCAFTHCQGLRRKKI